MYGRSLCVYTLNKLLLLLLLLVEVTTPTREGGK